jgi:integrase
MEAKRYEISAATFDSLTSVVKTLRRVVGDATLIVDIQHSDLLRYRNDLLTGNVVHPIHSSLNKSESCFPVNGMMSALSTILKLAYRGNFIKHTPYEGLRWLKKTKEPPDPLLPGEYLAFISSLTRSRYAVLLWTIAIHTGLRHGELAALAWEDVDLQKGEINVRRNLTNKNIFVLPKTDAGIRTVSLLKPALELYVSNSGLPVLWPESKSSCTTGSLGGLNHLDCALYLFHQNAVGKIKVITRETPLLTPGRMG